MKEIGLVDSPLPDNPPNDSVLSTPDKFCALYKRGCASVRGCVREKP